MRVIGLDLSLTGTGLAEVQTETGASPVFLTITSKGSNSDSLEARQSRIFSVRAGIMDFIVPRRPDLVMIEAPAFSSVSGHSHDRSGLWWLIIASLRAEGIPVMQVPPNVRAKYATGKGNAAKEVVVMAVSRRYPHFLFANNNEVDAFILALMGLRVLGLPLDEDLPKAHLSALDSMQADISDLRSRRAAQEV